MCNNLHVHRALNRSESMRAITYTEARNIQRDPFPGLGKPEPLKFNFSGYWSRRIDDEHRIVYKGTDDKIIFAQLRGHYG